MFNDLNISINTESLNLERETDNYSIRLDAMYMTVNPSDADLVLTYVFYLKIPQYREEFRFNYWFGAPDKKPMDILNWTMGKERKVSLATKKAILASCVEIINEFNTTDHRFST